MRTPSTRPRQATARWCLGSTVFALLVVAGCGADAEESSAARGSGSYQANCAACHGSDLTGSRRGPSLLDPLYLDDQLSDAEFRSAIRNGVEEELWEFGPMPASGALSDLQVAEVIAYVRARQQSSTEP